MGFGASNARPTPVASRCGIRVLAGEFVAFLQSRPAVLHEAQHASKPASARAPSIAVMVARQASPLAVRGGFVAFAREFKVFLLFKQMLLYEVQSNNSKQGSLFLCRFESGLLSLGLL